MDRNHIQSCWQRSVTHYFKMVSRRPNFYHPVTSTPHPGIRSQLRNRLLLDEMAASCDSHLFGTGTYWFEHDLPLILLFVSVFWWVVQTGVRFSQLGAIPVSIWLARSAHRYRVRAAVKLVLKMTSLSWAKSTPFLLYVYGHLFMSKGQYKLYKLY